MKLFTEYEVKDVLKDKKAAIISIPYSSLDMSVNTWVIDTCRTINDDTNHIGNFVDELIEANIFNVYILVYDVDAFNNTVINIKRDQAADGKQQVIITKMLNDLFEAVRASYVKRNYIACIQAGYTRTRKGITKTILTNSMFVASRRSTIKTDCRKEDITYNDRVKEFAQDKMNNVLCCIIAPYNLFEFDSVDEDAYNKCLFDVLYASFIPQENCMILVM